MTRIPDIDAKNLETWKCRDVFFQRIKVIFNHSMFELISSIVKQINVVYIMLVDVCFVDACPNLKDHCKTSEFEIGSLVGGFKHVFFTPIWGHDPI